MPSYAFKNFEEASAFANETTTTLTKILNAVEMIQPPSSVQEVNAAGTRTVVAEPQLPVIPAPPRQISLPVAPPLAVTTKSDESANAMRLAVGTQYSTLTDYVATGQNTYVPDFRNFCHVITHICKSVQTVRHFYLNSQHWHPLLVQAYYSTIALIFILEIQVQSGMASMPQILNLDAIKRRYRFETIPIPGPLVPFFQSLASGRTSIGQKEITVSPVINTVTGASAATNGLPATTAPALVVNATTPRIPSVMALLDQYVAILNLPAPGANVTMGQAISNWSLFGADILGNIGETAAPADLADQPAITAIPAVRAEVFRSPGFNDIIAVIPSIGQNIAQVIPQTRAYFPTRLALAAIPATTTLDGYCCLNINQGKWLIESTSVMSKMCSFFKASVPLSSISPVGSTAGQVEFHYTGAPIVLPPATRFPALPSYEFEGRTRSRNVTPADDLDSTVTMWNTDSYVNVAGAAHREGTFWTHSGIVKQSREVDVISQFGSIIDEHFVLNVAK